MTDIRGTPIHVYLRRQPTFTELADQAWQLALHQYFPDDTGWDRLVFALESVRLRVAASLAPLAPLTLAKYYCRHVLLRVVPIVALGLLVLYARDAIQRGLLGTGANVHDFLMLLGASLLVASAWGLWRWSTARETLAWAEAYRAEFLDRQKKLLSAEGWKGWRLIRDSSGYVYVPVDDPPEASN